MNYKDTKAFVNVRPKSAFLRHNPVCKSADVTETLHWVHVGVEVQYVLPSIEGSYTFCVLNFYVSNMFKNCMESFFRAFFFIRNSEFLDCLQGSFIFFRS